MSQQGDPQHEVYRQTHQSMSLTTQGLEWYNTQLSQLKEQAKMAQIEIDSLKKKLDDLQPNLKKTK